MKTLKFAILIIAAAVINCSNSWGQRILHTETTCNFLNYDSGDPIGIINGDVTYHFTIRLSKETGKIESLHWVAKECSVTNVEHQTVRIIDAGHDTQGVLWDFFNNPDYWNAYYGDDEITYPGTEDGWWDDIMPTGVPEEGTFVSMAFKMICKGEMKKMYCLAQLHMNANGDVKANVFKWYML